MLIRSSRARARRVLAMACAGASLLQASYTQATTYSFDTTSPFGDHVRWGDPGNWSPQGLPNQSGDVAIVDTMVFVDGNQFTGSLAAGTNAYVQIVVNNSLTFSGDSTNSGTLAIDDGDSYGGNSANLYVSGSASLGGVSGAPGQVVFVSAYQNRIASPDGNPANATLTLGAFETIGTAVAGSNGEIALNLVNNGTVAAGAGVITIDGPSLTNTATLSADAGGTLNLSSTTAVNAGGTILVASGGGLGIYASSVSGGTVSLAAGSNSTFAGSTLANGLNLAGGGGVTMSGAVTIDGSISPVTSSAAISVPTNSTVTLAGTLVNNGTITLADGDSYGGNFALFYASGDATLDGSGSLVFGSGYQNILGTPFAPPNSLTVGPNQTIATAAHGVGDISANLINAGTIDATDAGVIVLDGYSKSNSGTVRARNGGRLDLSSITLTNSGTVQTDATGTLNVVSSTITGGTLDLAGTTNFAGNADVTAATLTNSGAASVAGGTHLTGTLHNTGTGSFTVQTGGTLYLSAGSTHDNQGSIVVADSDSYGGNYAYLGIVGDVTVDGTPAHPGSITFGSAYQNYLVPNDPTDTLTIGASQSLVAGGNAHGFVSANLVNNGTIDAAGSGAYIEFDGVSVANNNAVHVASGAQITLNSTTLTAGSGSSTVTVDAGGTLLLNSATLGGGTFAGGGSVVTGGTFHIDASATPVTLAGPTFGVATNQTATLTGSITNTGSTLELADSDSYGGNAAYLLIDGPVTFSGTGGTLRFSTPYENVILPIHGVSSPDVLSLGAGQTLTTTPGGNGTVALAFANSGSVHAAGGAITFSGAPVTNSAAMSADAGGSINFAGASVDNTAGTVTLADDGGLSLSGSTFTGGTVNATATSPVSLVNSTIAGGTFATAANAQIGGQVILDASAAPLTFGSASVPTNAIVQVRGSVTTVGTLRLADTDSYNGNAAYLYVSGAAALDGTAAATGGVLFDSPYQNLVLSANGGGDSLTLGAHEAVTTSPGANGTVAVAVTNNGTIDASGGTISLTADVTNNATMRATAGGTLAVGSVTVANSPAAQVTTAAGSTLSLSSVTLTGGTVNTAGATSLATSSLNAAYTNSGAVTVFGGYSSLAGSLSNSGSVTVVTNGGLTLHSGSTYTNNGTLTLQDTDSYNGNAAYLFLDGAVTVGGTGQIAFGTAYQNFILPSSNGSTDALTIGAGQTLLAPGNTAGALEINTTNAGTISAAPGGSILIAGVTVTNSGTVAAHGSGGAITLSSSAVDSGASGTVLVEPGAGLYLANSTLAGGTLTGGGPVYVSGSSALDGTAHALTSAVNAFVPTNATLMLRGAITNNGSLQLADGDSYSGNGAYVYVTDPTTLGGSGQMLFNSPYQNVVYAISAASVLTVGANQTVATAAGGNGELSAPLVNDGTVNANAGVITLDGLDKTNGPTGTFSATNGGTLIVTANLTNYASNTLTGGAYVASGSPASTIVIAGADVTTNAASITLDGAGARIASDFANHDALANLSSNAGSLNLSNGNTLTLASASLTNSGTITIDASTLSLPSGDFVQTGGTTTLNNGGTLSTGAANTVSISGGTLAGSGTVSSDATVAATLSPGTLAASVGTLSFNKLTLTPTATTTLNLNGTAPGSFDKITVGGTATLGGILTGTLGFTPSRTDSFGVVSAGAIGGLFSNRRVGGTANGSGLLIQYSATAAVLSSYDQVHWIAGADGQWTAASNWDTDNTLPKLLDDVSITGVISGGGRYTVTLSSGAQSINSLTASDNLAITGGTLDLEAASSISGNLTLSGGTLSGKGALTLSGSGNAWTGGNLSRAGATTLANGGALAITAAGQTLSGTFNDAGAITLGGSGTLNFAGATLNVLNSGSLAVTSAATASTADSTSAINNAGTFTKSGLSTTTLALPFNNTGTVSITQGTLILSGGGTNSGSITVPAGSNLTVNATYAFNAGTSVSGAGAFVFGGGTESFPAGSFFPTGPVTFSAGNVTINNSISPSSINPISASVTFNSTLNYSSPLTINAGVVSFNGTQPLTSLTLNNGTVSGSGNVTLSGANTWNAGIMSGAGKTTVAAGATLDLPAATGVTLSRNLDNSGTLTHSGAGTIAFNSSASLTNFGTFNASGPGAIAPNVGVAAVVVNPGTLNKTGTSTYVISTGFSNPGTLNVSGGTFRASGSVTQLSGSSLTAGTWNVSNGATLDLPSVPSISTLASAASVTLDGSASTFNGLTGLSSNQGSLTIKNGKKLTLAGSFTNSGTLAVGASSGLLASFPAAGGNLTLTSTSSVSIDLASANPANNVITVLGGLTLGGSLNLTTTNFAPAQGQTFYLLSSGANVAGSFSNLPTNTRISVPGGKMLLAYAGAPAVTLSDLNTVRWNVDLSGQWTTPSDWTGGALPLSTDDVIIDRPSSTFTVTLTGPNQAVHSLTSNENLTLSNGNLDLAAASTINGNLSISGGNLVGAGNVTLNGTGNTWTVGGMSGTGTTAVAAGATLAATFGASLNLARAVVNNGTVNWSNTGMAQFSSGSITNSAGANFNLSGYMLQAVSGANSFANAGTLTKTSSPIFTSIINVPFANTGTVAVQSGVLQLGGASNPSNAGTVNVSSGATLEAAVPLSNAGKINLIAGTATLKLDQGLASSTVRAQLQSGYNGGAWTGASGITSTAAANDAGHLTAIGYSLAGSTYTLQLAKYGDANLDGTITADDYALTDKGHATGASTWWNGDFNYDGTVDQNDYLLIDTTYSRQLGHAPAELLAERESQFGADYVSALLAAVPEPGSAAGLGLALLPLARRRRQ